MAGLRYAAAQSASVPLDIAANVVRHLAFIDTASEAGVQLLVFPELSLCGYELAGMGACALKADDGRLAPLRERALKAKMTVVVGAPLANAGALPGIGAITFHPDGRTSVYRKHFLHAGEERHVTAGSAISQLHEVRGVKVALAICADTGQQQHAHAAAVAGAELYVAGSLISAGGYGKDTTQLVGYAKLFRMGVLMANHAHASGGYESAGRSAIWESGGELIIAAPGPGEMLVIAGDDGGTLVDVA
ncbi:carbon-nitrogen hydrolase family protein [Massilia sp. P8910]|uniref:carbon-nitrogen hydrolase family protein n=1 Tax=Massilia antarctica TaxID=2765360 RepID=UPI001E31208E|nr:carbon-nitrogen hydrolase family protein [Massilia antarctica]MCE3607393.1 carbon-nitrogen hydrolase family protein [Massilia antarctica]